MQKSLPFRLRNRGSFEPPPTPFPGFFIQQATRLSSRFSNIDKGNFTAGESKVTLSFSNFFQKFSKAKFPISSVLYRLCCVYVGVVRCLEVRKYPPQILHKDRKRCIRVLMFMMIIMIFLMILNFLNLRKINANSICRKDHHDQKAKPLIRNKLA